MDAIFAPEIVEMYPEGYDTSVSISGGMVGVFEGKIRPDHFEGVATVVTKLFNAVAPDIAYFGQKDAQQCAVIRRIIADLNVQVEIEVLPTVREHDGLALSSRNTFLTPEERKEAPVLYQSLQFAQHMIELGEKNSKKIIKEIKKLLNGANHNGIDYVSVVNPETLEVVETIDGKVLVILAVRFGTTRLIDNIIVE